MDLRLALLLIGLAVVALVFAVSHYSDFFQQLSARLQKLSAHRKRTSKRVTGKRNDPLLGNAGVAGQQDSLFNFEADETYQDASGHDLIADEDELDATPELNDAENQAQDREEPLVSLIDEKERQPIGPFTSLRQIDYWIKLSPAKPMKQSAIVAQLDHLDEITFPTQIHALTQEEPHWVDLYETDGETMIMDVVASFQLLCKGQAATLEELRAFDHQVSKLGSSMSAEKLMMATPEQAFEQSQKLVKFFAASCEPLEVSICAARGEAFMGKLIETSAKQQGLDYVEGDYARLKRMASNDIILYRMVNADGTGFLADMPATTQINCVKFIMMPVLSRTPGRDAKEMLDAVKAFASRVKGEIRIPGEREYHPDILLKLRNRVSNLEKEMIAGGLEPGGQEISRIFS